MAATTKPRRLLYPTELIDRNVARLQRDLRRLYKQYRLHHINKLQAQTEGESLINAAFKKAETDVVAFLSKHGLNDGDHAELVQVQQDFLVYWRGIINDF
jgi:hypothetical protein